MDIKKDNEMYMTIAQIAAQRSYAKRLKVGCVIVKNHSIISFGWNGMPTGYDNCVNMKLTGSSSLVGSTACRVKRHRKLAQNGYSSNGAKIFITHSPCIHCSLLIQKCGINEVYYHEKYRDDAGIQFLKKAGIKVEQL